MLELPFLLFTLIRSSQIAAYCLVAVVLTYVPVLVLKKPLTYLQAIQSILVTTGVFLFQTSRAGSKQDKNNLSILPVVFSFSGLIFESFGMIYRHNVQQKYSSGGVEVLFTTSLFTLVPATIHSSILSYQFCGQVNSGWV